jgi:hypothetical protein
MPKKPFGMPFSSPLSSSGMSRRSLLANAAAASALASLGWSPRDALAARGERKFIFFFASGAWDTTSVFDPHHGSSKIDMDMETFTRTLGNLAHTGGEDRPNVMRYFQRWGRQTAIVNGVDAHTVGHDSGRMMTMTGTSAENYPDWPTVIASSSTGDYPLPHVVFSGPSYGGHLAGSVVRAGGGTLLDLIDGSIVGASDAPAPQLSTPSDQMIDAFVFERSSRFAANKGVRQGIGRERSAALLDNLDRAMEIEGRRFEAGLDDLGNDLLDQAVKASELMRLGLTRTAMIGIPGAWDCHGGVEVNAPQFESFFGALDALMDHLAITPGQSTRWLIDEVVVVALSEFGRTPLWNGAGGKDHWPFTSALVAGSGVRGGRTYGATDDGLVGMKVDFRSGSQSDTGDMLGTENLGVALLKLGGVDPDRFLPGIQSFDAILRG